MAKFKLQAGAEIDLLTDGELAKRLDAQTRALNSAPDVVDSEVTVTVDAAGNVGGGAATGGGTGDGVVIYGCPLGMRAQIQRIHLDDGAHTPAAPLAAGWLRFSRDQAGPGGTRAFLPAGGSTAVIPAVLTDGDSAIVLRDGQSLVLNGAGLPAGLSFNVSLQVRLWPVVNPRTRNVAEV